MAAFRRRLGQYPFLGGFVGLALFCGGAIYFETTAIFTLLMAMLGFILGAAMLLTIGDKRGHHEEIDAALRDGRGDMEKIRSQIPYNQGQTPDMF